jgi:phosphohistidine phosphatase SixA
MAALAPAAGCDLGSDDEHSGRVRQPEVVDRVERLPVRLVVRLRHGGYVLALRHAATDPTTSDRTSDPYDCSRQRNLTAEGRNQARLIGRELRSLGIPVGQVLASPVCRTRETARLAFGRLRPSRTLLAGGFLADGAAADRRRAGFRRLLDRPPRPRTNTVLVSHGSAIDAATHVGVAEGEAVIVAPGRGRFHVIGTIPADYWDRVERP